MSKEYPLNVPAPHHFTFAVRDIPDVTVEQRERVLKATHYNEFAFPAGMLTVDMLSDSGTTAMTNQQWASLFLGDEAYGRNTGYYVLLDTFRDIFERGGEKNWKKIIDLCPHRLPRRGDHDGERLSVPSTRAACSTAAPPRWSAPTPSSSSRAAPRSPS